MKTPQIVYKSISLFLLSCILLLGITDSVHAQSKQLLWERFDVTIVVNADGTLDITESQTIRFIRGTFTQGARTIPRHNLSRIDNWSVTDEDGRAYAQPASGSQENTFSVEASEEAYKVRWFFPAISNGSATYVIQYRVHNALRFYDGGDQVWWKAIFGDRPAKVVAGDVRVILADDGRGEQAAKIREWAAYINDLDASGRTTVNLIESQQEIIFQLEQWLEAGEEFEVRVEFTNGFAEGVAPPWQMSADESAAQRETAAQQEAETAYRRRLWDGITGAITEMGLGGIGLLLSLGGPAFLYALWHFRGREKPVVIEIDYLSEPPDDLPPGVVGTLLDKSANMREILATLVDLAQRGVLTITKKAGRGRSDFVYTIRKHKMGQLRAYEQSLLDAFFGGDEKVRLSHLRGKFYVHLDNIEDNMYKASVKEGLFDHHPQKVRSRYFLLAIILSILTVVTGYLLNRYYSDASMTLFTAIGMGLISAGLFALSIYMPSRTTKGAESVARWRAFKNYLENIDAYGEMQARKEIWDRWLPYAVAFGIEEEFIHKFESADAPLPTWFLSATRSHGKHQKSRRNASSQRFGRMLKNTGKILKSRPKSMIEKSENSSSWSRNRRDNSRRDSRSRSNDRSSSNSWASSGWGGGSDSGNSNSSSSSFSGGGSSGGGGSGGGSGDFD